MVSAEQTLAPYTTAEWLAVKETGDVKDYIALLKPRVMSLVVFTGAVGLWLAPSSINPFLAFIAILSIALSAGGSGAVNMWYDRDIDAVMQRTAKRPIPAGKVTPESAVEFGWLLIVVSFVLMGLATNWLAAGLLLFAALFYVFIYTMWLKRRTPQNIVIGGAAGAFPPMIGWAAVTGDVSLMPVMLFLIVFLWTPPHFWALALYRNGDYTKAGVPMLPVVSGARTTKLHMIAYTLALIPVALAPSALGYSGLLYAVGAAGLSGYFLAHALKVWCDETDVSAKKMFKFSLLYLAGLFALILLDHALLGA